MLKNATIDLCLLDSALDLTLYPTLCRHCASQGPRKGIEVAFALVCSNPASRPASFTGPANMKPTIHFRGACHKTHKTCVWSTLQVACVGLVNPTGPRFVSSPCFTILYNIEEHVCRYGGGLSVILHLRLVLGWCCYCFMLFLDYSQLFPKTGVHGSSTKWKALEPPVLN